MNVVFDLILLAILGLFAFWGYRKGLIRMVLSLGRLILAVVITVTVGSPFSTWLHERIMPSSPALLAAVSGHVLLFLLAFVLLTMAMVILGKLADLPLIRTGDKLLGLGVGCVSGLITVALVSSVLYAVVYITGNMSAYDDSVVFQTVQKMNIFQLIFSKFME